MKLRRGWRLWVVVLAAGCAAAGARATEPPVPDASDETLRLDSQHGQRVRVTEPRALDPVVFTEIRPYTTDAAPVRLPPDQSLD